MENLINEAKSFLGTDQGQKIEQMIESKYGIDPSKYLGGQQSSTSQQSQSQTNNDNAGNDYSSGPSSGENAFGNENDLTGNYDSANASGGSGGYGGNEGGQGSASEYLGGDGDNSQGQGHRQQQQFQGQNQEGRRQGQGESDYAGYDQNDSTVSGGGYGANQGGDSYSRQNQMGTDNSDYSGGGSQGRNEDNYDGPSRQSGGGRGGENQSGYSTPGYRQDEEYGGSPNNRQSEGSQGLNPYGNNDSRDDQNPYHEQDRN